MKGGGGGMPLLVTCVAAYHANSSWAQSQAHWGPAQAPWEAGCLVPCLACFLLGSGGPWEVHSLGYTPSQTVKGHGTVHPSRNSGSRDGSPSSPHACLERYKTGQDLFWI